MDTFAPIARVSAAPALAEPSAAQRIVAPPQLDGSRAAAADLSAVVSQAGELTAEFIIDSLIDVGPAGPATASTRGVVMVDRRDQALVAQLAALSKGSGPAVSPITPLESGAGPFPLARGPGVLDGYAYWVSKHQLLRSKLVGERGQPREVLRDDARNGTRVAVAQQAVAQQPQGSKPHTTIVGYIATAKSSAPARGEQAPVPADAFSTGFESQEKLIARLWRPGGPPIDLTPPASSTSSLTLAALDKGWVTLALEGRTGMSIVHAWTLRPEGQDLLLSDSGVVWVGGGTQPLTEIVSVSDRNMVWGLITLEHDITHFGMVSLGLGRAKFGVFGQAPPPEAQAAWYIYPNGIDPAPAFGAIVCQKPLVVLAQPSSKEPGVPQELRLVRLDPDAPARATPIVLARSSAFFDISVAAVPGGALLVYSADRRTWARTLRCLQGLE